MGSGGKGGGGKKRGGYESPTQFSDLSPGQVQGMGLNLPKLDVGGLAGRVEQGRTLTGQKIPEYQASQAFRFRQPGSQFRFRQPGQQFTFQDYGQRLQAAPTQAYQGAQDVARENVLRGTQQAYAQAGRNLGARGMGRGGMVGGAFSDVARQTGQQLSDLARQTSFQQAQDQMAMDRAAAQMGMQTQQAQAAENLARSQMGFGVQQAQAAENLARSGMGMQTQQLQAAENARRAQESLQAQQALTGLQGQQIGMLGGLQQAGTQQEMAPYQMLRDLFGAYTGIGFQPAPGAGQGKDPFGAMMQMGSVAANAYCLPKGTEIQMVNGKIPVEDVRIGDQTEEGGKVIAVIKRERHEGHRFFEQEFETGIVVMSLGHPFFDKIKAVRVIEEHPSEWTYDILTENGFYYVNGVKLGSTI